MNNEIEKNLYIGVLGDDGSYTRIEKIADDISISHTFKIPNMRKAKKKYKKFYALIKEREMYLRRLFVNNITMELQIRVNKAIENAILYGSEQL